MKKILISIVLLITTLTAANAQDCRYELGAGLGIRRCKRRYQ